jgi:hypothetical protein
MLGASAAGALLQLGAATIHTVGGRVVPQLMVARTVKNVLELAHE